MRFLVDTAATTVLNVKTFASGRSKRIHISSWSGVAATSAREVFLPELLIGSYRLANLRLPAIDLTPIGKACGGQIDGILAPKNARPFLGSRGLNLVHIKRVGIASVRTLREARHTLTLIYNDCGCPPIDDRLTGKIS